MEYPAIFRTIVSYGVDITLYLEHCKTADEVRAAAAHVAGALVTAMRTVDECVGVVLDTLDQAGLADDAFLFFTTDHGLPFPFMRCTLYDSGIRVALIIRYPAARFAIRSTDALVSQIDIFPTICDLLGAAHPPWLEGVSMTPLLTGETDRIRDEVFAEVTFHAAYEPMRAVRTDRYKLIWHYSDRVVACKIDDSPSKTFLLASGLLPRNKEREQLFDLYLDPQERVNRIGSDGYAPILEDLRARLLGWMEATGDPILDGDVPRPEGASVNRLDAISPREPTVR